VPAYFALKLNNIEDVNNFSIKSNVENLGKFDDVIIDVTTNEKNFYFALQLKHKKHNKYLTPEELFFTKESPFSLEKYCKSFKQLKNVDKRRQFILYTNAKFDPNRTAEMTIFTMIQDDRCDGHMFFNTSSGGGNVYRFEVNNKTPEDGKITKSDYKRFFSRFRFFVCQKNFTGFEQATKILQNHPKFENLRYLHLFRKWHQGRFTNKIIDKTTVNVHQLDIFLSGLVANYHLQIAQNEKLKLFEKIVKKFDVTLIKDSFEKFAEHLVEDSDLEEGVDESRKEMNKGVPNTSLEQLISLAKEKKMIESSVTTLEPQMKCKMLQYCFQKPIIVDYNERSAELIYNMMKLHQLGSKIKFIFIGEEIQFNNWVRQSTRFRIFENVNDLRSTDNLYSEVTRTCRLSLQGRNETTLQELIGSCKEICEHVGAKEVFQMLKGNFLIGQATESLPSSYVNRKVSFKVEKIDAILDGTFFKKHLAVAKFDDRKVKNIENKIRKCNINVVDVDDYRTSTQISKERTIISTNEECSNQLLQGVLEESDDKSVVYLRISEENDFLIISIEENQIHCLTGQINILCADLGMGKTTMLKKLRSECDSRFWTIYVELKNHNEFFKAKHDANELLNQLMEGNENSFSTHIRNVFLSKKKIYFFFDGLEEIENSWVDNVLDSVKKLLSEGFHVWISSRKNLKTELENCFERVAMDIEEIGEEQQKSYINDLLTEKYEPEQIENFISKIFNTDNNFHVLGNALQLVIITQKFLADKELQKRVTEDTFVFTRLYELLFLGILQHNKVKEESKNPHLSLVAEGDILENHELVAVHSVFGEEVLKKLNVDLRRIQRFIDKIKTNKDILGIVTKVNDEGKAVFEHFTYREYFAARLFADKYNFDKARLIREDLFSDRRKNLMMTLNVILAEDNPLHLAVIYRNVDQIEKYIEDKNVYDKAGRNPLHLATYIEPRYVDRKSCFIDCTEAIGYLTNIGILEKIMKFNYAHSDKLFGWNALEYAFENKSFVSVEMILKRCENSDEKFHPHTNIYQYISIHINDDNLVFFCLTHGCSRLLSSILENSEKSKNYFKENAWIIIEHTIKNCYFQEIETLRFLIRTLQHKCDFNVDSTNERGQTALNLAEKYRKTYAVKLLRERKAPTNINPLNGDA
jgi:ankyrin repeat protein